MDVSTERFSGLREGRSLQRINLIITMLGIMLGGAQVIANQGAIYPDAMQYLDLGRAILSFDWNSASNAYWSPFYGVLLAFVIDAVEPSASRFALSIHCVHYATFVAFMFSILRFARSIRDWRMSRISRSSKTSSEIEFLTSASMTSFCCLAALRMTPAYLTTPDCLVGAFFLLLTAELLDVSARDGVSTDWMSTKFGLLLGVAYLTKAIFFPLAILFLTVRVWLSINRIRKLTLSMVAFLLVAIPWIMFISESAGHLTFGESGRLNFAWYVDELDNRYPPVCGETEFARIHDSPDTHVFDAFESASFPLAFNPSYWFSGLEINFEFQKIGNGIRRNVYAILKTLYGHLKYVCILIVVICSFAFLARPGPRWRGIISILVPSIAGFAAYSVTWVQSRYLLPFVAVTGSLIIAVSAPTRESRFLTVRGGCLVLLMIMSIAGMPFGKTYSQVRRLSTNQPIIEEDRDALLSEFLQRNGIQRGAKLAYIRKSNFGLWASMGGFRVVADIDPRHADRFWALSKEDQANLTMKLAKRGIQGIVAEDVTTAPNGWQQVERSRYYFLPLVK